MGKISIQDLSSVLAERRGLNKKDASAFISAMFDLVQEELEKDKLVKIKGLGTFKIIDVDDRESINVNTGERVLIEGHGKITFTPDSLMKELVNKPFSQFETVVLNDGVEFEDDSNNTTIEETDSDSVDSNTDPSSRSLVDFGLGRVAADLSSFPVIDDVVGKSERVSDEENTKSESTSSQENASEELAPDNSTKPEPKFIIHERVVYKSQNWYFIIAACIIGLLIGYFVGTYFPFDTPTYVWANAVDQENVTNQEKVAIPKVKSLEKSESDIQAASVVTEKKDSIKKDSVKKDSVKTEIQPKVVQTKKEDKQVKQSTDIHAIYAAKDARVRLGAYRIVGTDRVVKAQKGETISRISRRYFGPGMECYVEVYNGLKSSSTLKPGQEIKIPKLKYKIKKKR